MRISKYTGAEDYEELKVPWISVVSQNLSLFSGVCSKQNRAIYVLLCDDEHNIHFFRHTNANPFSASVPVATKSSYATGSGTDANMISF